jgi:cytosine/adenosine deaminase-related metal-dependent hydrolase
VQLDLDSAWISGELADGVRLHLDGERIAAVEPIARPENGWHALPGFVNAHCHLDLTAIRGEELAHATFAEWLAELLPRRGALADAEIDAATAEGARALLATGTAAVGDIDSFGRSAAVLRATPLEGLAFRELVGRFDAARFARLVAESHAADADADAAPAALRRGFSPHAPYSTGPDAYAAAFAAAGATPVASHLAETAEEDELLRRGRGPLADLFARLGFSPPVWTAAGDSTVAPVFALVPPAATLLVVHGNRLTRDELAECARRSWPVVYCPRSHRYFGHPRHPAVQLLELGGTLALGTDSRASNPGLDLWAEMACFRSADPAVPDAAILAAATSGGRRALRLDAAELAPGQPATLQLVRRRDGARGRGRDLVAAAVRAELATHALFVRGRLVDGGEGGGGAGLPRRG